MEKKICVGVIGSGMISEIYLKNMTTRFPAIQVKAVASKHIENARKRAEQFGLASCTVEELLADPEIEMVVNLTPVGSHYDIVKAALEAGKHVYTEKTITDSPDKAAELVKLAADKGLYLGCAPDTFLGAGIQTARSVVDSGTIGEVTGFMITTNRNWCLLMNWIPFLREKGPGMCYDFAVYHLTALVSILGPVASVAAYTHYPKNYTYMIPGTPDFGKPLDCPNETRVSATLQLRSGVTGTMMMDGDSIMQEEPLMRIYGTKGILEFGDPNQFGSFVRVLAPSKPSRERVLFAEVEMVNEFSDNSRGLGAADLAQAIAEGKPSRADAAMGYHVLEVLSAILESGNSHRFVDVESTFTLPEPMPKQ